MQTIDMVILFYFIYSRIKKGDSQGKQCHTRAMMYSLVNPVNLSKINAHHVPLGQSVTELRK